MRAIRRPARGRSALRHSGMSMRAVRGMNRGVVSYLVKEMFGPTLQGEGAHAGRACVFLRFAACNLACPGCDTDFSPEGAVRMTAAAVVDRLRELDTGH